MRKLVLPILGLSALGCGGEIGDSEPLTESEQEPLLSTGNVTFGINADDYDEFVAAVPGAQGYRGYARKPDSTHPHGFVPASWPTESGVTTVFTLYLKHDALLAGEFDEQLLDFFATAPVNSYVTLWQEVGTLDFSAYHVSPSNIASMNSYMQTLIKNNRGGHGTNKAAHIKFGPIVIGIGAVNQAAGTQYNKLKDLMKGGPYDFYGVDVYDGDNGFLRNSAGSVSQAKINEKMGFFRMMAQQLSGRTNPRIVIAECNSPTVSNRPGLFTYLGEWMNSHHGTVMLTHYNPNGQVSGPWLPCKPGNHTGCSTINALKSLQAKYGN